jgi:hypothetical protein
MVLPAEVSFRQPPAEPGDGQVPTVAADEQALLEV